MELETRQRCGGANLGMYVCINRYGIVRSVRCVPPSRRSGRPANFSFFSGLHRGKLAKSPPSSLSLSFSLSLSLFICFGHCFLFLPFAFLNVFLPRYLYIFANLFTNFLRLDPRGFSLIINLIIAIA